jgi:hypothetical protein
MAEAREPESWAVGLDWRDCFSKVFFENGNDIMTLPMGA